MNYRLAYGSLTVGFLLVVVGILWNQLLPQSVYWSEADQAEFDQATLSAHAASVGHSHSHSDDQQAVPDLATAKERLEQSRRKLSWARTQRDYMGRAISVVGVVFLLVGAALLRNIEE